MAFLANFLVHSREQQKTNGQITNMIRYKEFKTRYSTNCCVSYPQISKTCLECSKDWSRYPHYTALMIMGTSSSGPIPCPVYKTKNRNPPENRDSHTGMTPKS